jgi:hypothetical protein
VPEVREREAHAAALGLRRSRERREIVQRIIVFVLGFNVFRWGMLRRLLRVPIELAGGTDDGHF